MSGVRGKFALRWIGLHAVAFGLTYEIHWGLALLFPDTFISRNVWPRVPVLALSFGIPLAVAQTFGSERWPASCARWTLATCLGQFAAFIGVAGVMNFIIPFVSARQTEWETMRAGIRLVCWFTEACLLGGAQALAIIRRAPTRQVIYWYGNVIVAWLLAGVLTSFLHSWIDWKRFSTLPSFLQVFMTALPAGACFGTALLPAARRIVAKNQPTTT